ncbi:MAG: hypothetical protein HY017_29860 [Betaproteobacteria bacterium]|nr:hypothetical protein [Betaproteobacteria bacterium]
MNDPIPWTFFCTETDYPKFLPFLPSNAPSTYADFVSRVDKGVEDVMEQLTVVKTNVGFDEFLAFCAERGKKPDYDTLLACTFQAWGRNGQS